MDTQISSLYGGGGGGRARVFINIDAYILMYIAA